VSIAVTEEHVELARAARRWADNHCPPAVPRAWLDGAGPDLPPFWSDLAAMGWLGLAVAEAHGGEGYSVAELAVVLEELGRAMAPGPFVPTVLAAAVLEAGGAADLVADLVSGTRTAAVAFTGDPAAPLLAGAHPGLLILPAGEAWVVVDAGEVAIDQQPSIDATRPLVRVTSVPASARRLPGVTAEWVRDLATLLLSAEAIGVAGWCVDTAAAYAKVREQFGRPIGEFQGVKHRCADMLIAVEEAKAVTWDAARAWSAEPGSEEAGLAVAVAGALAPAAAFRAAKDCIQVLGGIGFTWEHDAHLYLKRATAVRQLVERPATWRARAIGSALAGTRRTLNVDLGPDAEPYRREVRAFVASIAGEDRTTKRRRMADEGYIVPYWPEPWGRGAGPVEQLVIDEEFAAAHLRAPHLAVGAWALPTIITHGTPEQQERWVRPTLYGELAWCQMFSEPGAGSDLASLATKATRVDGGWSLSGQKVWTSMAKEADWAICLARTNPSAPKHEGITYFLVDMRSEGLDVRPLRELTGHAMFNEVFLSDVFVPDDCVVGEVDDGWKLARTTLANERVSMGSGSSFGHGVEALLAWLARHPDADPMVRDEVAGLLVEAQALAVLAYRMTLRALAGADPGSESSVRKLAGVEHDQRVQELGLGLLGPDGAALAGEAETWAYGFLANRCLTIAGGTSEIQRNVIAERLLGLPRDPAR
jgi:alkylation response protein AidB-like acyl-CoA dehydrogenase